MSDPRQINTAVLDDDDDDYFHNYCRKDAYHLASSDSPHLILTQVQFKEDNYDEWVKAMRAGIGRRLAGSSLASHSWTTAAPSSSGSSSPMMLGWAAGTVTSSSSSNHLDWDAHSRAAHSPAQRSNRGGADTDGTDERLGMAASASASAPVGIPGL
ncbi:hypothetical protein M9H77_29792 [Catharanthus roseus]|uniref:Uncharacterized protein n=1 Tax=Catharanthus roseus TaxID=4058 RepID=A0ACB9ZWG9_CATRO|nr:hypothetical protein M9H77_29792 [Catharanthus roseus]